MSIQGNFHRVLFISQDADFKAKLQVLFEKNSIRNVEIRQVFPVEKALGEIQSTAYDLIILDIPDGGDCASAAEKVCLAIQHIPLVVMSHTGIHHALRAVRKGAQSVIDKQQSDDFVLLQTILTSIDRKQVENELRVRDGILQAVNYAAEIFLAQSDWESRIDVVLSRLGKATQSERVYVIRTAKDAAGGLVVNLQGEWDAAGVETRNGFASHRDVENASQGLGRWLAVLCEGELMQGVVSELPSEEQPLLMKSGVVSFIVVPIFVKREWWGFIGFDYCRHEKRWSPVEVDALKTAASIFGAALARQATEERLTYLATHDYLTNLPNRMLFEDRFSQAVARSTRSGDQFGIISIDLDKFKQVNDTHGHPVGDSVLTMVGQRLKTALRESDTLARIGGDEFAVIAEGIHNKGDVMRVMEKLAESLKPSFKVEGSDIRVKASMGASVFPTNGHDLEALMKVADAALYQVKQSYTGYKVFSDDQISLLDA